MNKDVMKELQNKDMMKEVKDSAYELADLITALLPPIEKAEHMKKYTKGITDMMVLYCIHARTNPRFQRQLDRYMLDRQEQK